MAHKKHSVQAHSDKFKRWILNRQTFISKGRFVEHDYVKTSNALTLRMSGRTDGRTEMVWLLQRSALRAMRTRYNQSTNFWVSVHKPTIVEFYCDNCSVCLLQGYQCVKVSGFSIKFVTYDRWSVVMASSCLSVQFPLMRMTVSADTCPSILVVYTLTMHCPSHITSLADKTINNCWVWPAVVSVSCWPISGLLWPRQTSYAANKVRW